MNQRYDADTPMTDKIMENLNVDDALVQKQQMHEEGDTLHMQNLEKEMNSRWATIEELERTAESRVDSILKLREAVPHPIDTDNFEENIEDEEFKKDFEASPITTEYLRLVQIIQHYEDLVGALTTERSIATDSADELESVVNQARMREDESRVMEKVDSTVEKHTNFTEKTIERMIDSFEDRMDRMIESHERMLERELNQQQPSGGGDEGIGDLEEYREEPDGEEEEPEFVCPKCDDAFDTKRGLDTHLGQVHNID